MAGSNKLVRGFWPVVGSGGSTTPKVREYHVADATTNSIGQGHPVILEATGTVTRLATIAGSSLFVGVAAHFVSRSGTGRTVAVYDDPRQLFEVQLDDNSATNRAAIVGLNFRAVSANTYNSTTHQSMILLDGSLGAATSSTLGLSFFKAIALSRNVDKDETGASVSYIGVIGQFNPETHVWAKDSSVGV